MHAAFEHSLGAREVVLPGAVPGADTVNGTDVNRGGQETAEACSHDSSAASGSAQFSACDLLRRWFLVLTKPWSEEIAKTNLERQGYCVYYPRLLRPTLHRGRWVDRIVALFPRYLFVQLDTVNQALAPIRSTLGVASVVRFGSESAVVPNSIVEDIKHRGDPHTGLHRLSLCPTLQPGCRVHVRAGVFGGLDGIFERDAADERVVILLRILGQDTPVRVPSRFVHPALAS